MLARVRGARELRARLDAMGDTSGLTRQWAVETAAGAKRRVRRQTGTTGRSIRVVRATKDGAEVVVGGAGLWLERGTRPHIIRPRKAKVLAWGGARTQAGRLRKGARAQFFARVVRHPGTRPYPFLMPAAKEALEKIGIRRIIDLWNRGR